jgi:hypothetical protein
MLRMEAENIAGMFFVITFIANSKSVKTH